MQQPSIHKPPLVSVITVSFNDAVNLQMTIKNVAKQDYPHIEYLVIDGGSTDNSLAVIQENKTYINTWVSEKDKGIFDAMNKGVIKATGDYVLFMNAGDWFLSDNVISLVFAQKKSIHADFIYGNHEVHYPGFVKKKEALPLHYLWKYMAFSHQSLFTKRAILLAKPFDLSYHIAADFNFIFNCYKEGKTFYNTNIDMAGYLAGGHSEKKVIQAYRENMKTVFAHRPSLKIRIFHYWLIYKQLPLVLLRKLIPEKLYLTLMKWKNTFKS